MVFTLHWEWIDWEPMNSYIWSCGGTFFQNFVELCLVSVECHFRSTSVSSKDRLKSKKRVSRLEEKFSSHSFRFRSFFGFWKNKSKRQLKDFKRQFSFFTLILGFQCDFQKVVDINAKFSRVKSLFCVYPTFVFSFLWFESIKLRSRI